jgi:hypothetical protein
MLQGAAVGHAMPRHPTHAHTPGSFRDKVSVTHNTHICSVMLAVPRGTCLWHADRGTDRHDTFAFSMPRSYQLCSKLLVRGILLCLRVLVTTRGPVGVRNLPNPTFVCDRTPNLLACSRVAFQWPGCSRCERHAEVPQCSEGRHG